MKKYIFSLLVISIGTLVYQTLSESNTVISYTSGPPTGKTGSPGDGGSTCNGCHSGTVNLVTGWITSNIPTAGYIAGDTYTITLTAFGTTEVKFGFQATSEKLSDNSKTGTPILTNSAETQIVGTDYVEHTTAGTTGSTGSHTWSYDWIAPAVGTGDVAFYAAFNVSNNNAASAGDLIYISSLQLPELILENVFVNELHYDNSSTDSLEGIEIAGEAGIDLSCYELVLYNGHDSTVYNIVPLSGTIPNQSCGYGTMWFPITGTQNGPADGFALYDICNMAVLQFLSYEGTIIAADGPAMGMTSTDIGINETASTNGGFSLQLQGSGTTYNDFTWSGPDSNTYGMVNSAQDFGTIGAALVASSPSICQGDSDTLTLFPTGGISPYTFFWNNGLSQAQFHTVSPTTTTTYTAYVVDAANCSSNTEQVTITVNPNPQISTSADTTICEGSSLNISCSASTGTPPYTYSWNNSLPDSAGHTLTPTTTTTYSVSVIDSEGCLSSVDSITIGVNSSPIIDLSAMVIDSSTCGNNDGSITGINIASTGNHTIEWMDDNSNIVGSAIGLTNVASGNYTLTVVNAAGCSSSSGTLSISDAGGPSLSVSPDTAICENDSTTITAIATSGTLPYTYFWSNSLPDTNSNVVSPLQTTTYSVLVTDNAGCQSGMDSVNVKVNALPLAGFTSAINGLNVVFTNTSTGAATHQWDFGDGNTSSDTNPIHNYSADGSYTVCLTAISSDGCVASLCKTISVSATGISQVNPLGLKVYPNPSKTGIFNMLLYNSMVTEQPTISIYNTSGEQLVKRGFSPTAKDCQIDLSNQPNGIYYIRVSGSKTVINKKITIIR